MVATRKLIRAYKKLTAKINKLLEGKYNESKLINLIDRETGMYKAFCEVFQPGKMWKSPNTMYVGMHAYYRAILKLLPVSNWEVKRILKEEKKLASMRKETKYFNFYNNKSIYEVHGMQSDFEPFQGKPNPEVPDWMKEINERLKRGSEIEDMEDDEQPSNLSMVNILATPFESSDPCDCFKGNCKREDCSVCKYFDFSGVPKGWSKPDPDKWDDEEEVEDLKERGVYQESFHNEPCKCEDICEYGKETGVCKYLNIGNNNEPEK